MIPDSLCPECHGRYDLLLVKRDRLVKKCVECGHRWNEEHEAFLVRPNGYVDIDSPELARVA